MKTPREILLEQQAEALPDLDRIRRDVVADLGRAALCRGSGTATDATERVPPASRPAWSPLTWAVVAWEQLVLPSRYAWAGVAVAWLCIVTLNMALSDGNAPALAQRPAPDAAQVELAREQRALEAELLGTRLVAQPMPARQDRSQAPAFNDAGALGWREENPFEHFV